MIIAGVTIVDSSVTVYDEIQEGESNDVGFQVSLTSDSNGGAAVGSNLWSVTAFASANSDGSGTRYDEQPITLSSSQAGTTLIPGATATISGLTYPLDLQDGPTCSQFEYVCVEVEKSTSASPDFELSPETTTTCTPVECRSKYYFTQSFFAQTYTGDFHLAQGEPENLSH